MRIVLPAFCRVPFLVCFFCVFFGNAGQASAQNYQLLVAGGANELDETQHSDIVEESAYIADDFGGYFVTRDYQLEGVVDSRVRRAIANCEDVAECYVNALFGSVFDYLLVVHTQYVGADVYVRYQTIDLKLGVQVALTEAYMPTPTEFPYLLAPCQAALKVTPNWIDRGPVVTAPPIIAPPPPVALSPTRDQRPERFREPMRPMTIGGAAASGVGAGLLLGGLALGFASDDTLQEIQAFPHSSDELADLQRKGRTQQRAANGTMIAGATAIVVGVVLLIVDAKASEKDDTARARLTATPDGFSVQF